MTEHEFAAAVPQICGRDTAFDPTTWSSENPTHGHCAIISLLAQALFGGEIVRASLEGTAFAHSQSHYWNRLKCGERDFTADQFQGHRPPLVGTACAREPMLRNAQTARRYAQLSSRFDLL